MRWYFFKPYHVLLAIIFFISYKVCIAKNAIHVYLHPLCVHAEILYVQFCKPAQVQSQTGSYPV